MYQITSKQLCLGLGVLGFCLSIWSCYKIKKTNDILQQSFEDLSDKTQIDVENIITEKTIERSLNRSVDNKVNDLSRTIIRRIEDDIHTQVRGAITTSYSDIKKSVGDEVTK